MKAFYRVFMLVFLMAALILPASAQNPCREAAEAAATLLDQASQAIADGDPAQADILIVQARELLTEGCRNIEPATDPTAEPDPNATAAPTQQAASAGNFTVTAPEVTADGSIFFVRFAHTGIDSGPLDIYVNAFGQTPVVANLSFGEATGLIAMPAGQHVMVARSAGSAAGSEPLSTLSWDFGGNSTWAVTAAGLLSTYAFIFEPVNIIRTPLDGQARIRIVNWVAGAERLSVTNRAGVAFADRIGWVGIGDREVDPGTDSLTITGVSGNQYGDPIPAEFMADTVYTLLLIGGKDGEPAVQILALETPQDQTRVRFINNRDSAVDIHVRPGNALLLANLAPNATTEWIALPSQAVTFVAYVPGTGPTGQEQSALSTQLRPGRDLTIVLRSGGAMDVRDSALTP